MAEHRSAGPAQQTAQQTAGVDEEPTDHLLFWAAGFRADPPSDPGAAPDALLGVVRAHRLVGRLLERFAENTEDAGDAVPAWAGPLHRELRRLHTVQLERHRANAAAFAELAGRLPAGHRLMWFKGPAHYALTGRTTSIRDSADIDVLAEDPGPVITELKALGYREAKTAAAHEFFTGRRGEHEFDVHHYVPVPRYAPGLREAVLRGEQTHDWETTRVDWPTAAPYTTRSSAPGMSGITVPGPALATVIACVNAFKDYLSWASYPSRLRPMVRWGDLAEVRLLARTTADPALLRACVGAVGAQDAFAWADRMLASLGCAPLLGPGGAHSAGAATDAAAGAAAGAGRSAGVPPDGRPAVPLGVAFPQNVWRGFWAALPDVERCLRRGGVPIGKVAAQLGARVHELPPGEGLVWRLGDPGTPRVLTRRSPDAPRHPVTVALRRTPDALLVEVGKPPCEAGSLTRLKVDLGGTTATEWTHRGGEREAVCRGEDRALDLACTADGCRSTARFAWPGPPGRPGAAGATAGTAGTAGTATEVPLLLGHAHHTAAQQELSHLAALRVVPQPGTF